MTGFLPIFTSLLGTIVSMALQPSAPSPPKPAKAPPAPAPAPVPVVPEVPKEPTIPAEDVQASEADRRRKVKRQSSALDMGSVTDLNPTGGLQFKSLLGQ